MPAGPKSETVDGTPAQRGGVALGLTGFAEAAGRAIRRLEPSRPGVTVIIASHDIALRTPSGSEMAHKAFVVGASCPPLLSRHDGCVTCIEIDIPPWASGSILGTALSCEVPVSLVDAIGPEAGELVDRLAEGVDWEQRFALVERFLDRRLDAATHALSPEVRWAWERLERSGGRASIRGLASEIGWSGRHFGRRFIEETGVMPKMAARRLRFDRARNLVECTPLALAEIAAACGYADQSHMTREFVELAGCSPAIYRAARFPDLPGTPADVLGA
jgi:AraC-like DNA-binding protein